jgi:hypothetical protein
MAWRLLVVSVLCALSALGCGRAEAEASPRTTGASLPPPEVPTRPVPAVFTGRSYVEAKGAAAGSGRFLIVVGVNPFSSTCTMMDETTWSDPSVAGWIRRRALAVRVDVVRDRKRAQALGIRITPTIIVYSGGREIDRTVGYETPERLLRWLEAARKRAVRLRT